MGSQKGHYVREADVVLFQLEVVANPGLQPCWDGSLTWINFTYIPEGFRTILMAHLYHFQRVDLLPVRSKSTLRFSIFKARRSGLAPLLIVAFACSLLKLGSKEIVHWVWPKMQRVLLQNDDERSDYSVVGVVLLWFSRASQGALACSKWTSTQPGRGRGSTRWGW